jgi:SnoaL-like domain
MSTMTGTGRAFDGEALRRGIVDHDARALAGLYAAEAELQVVDCRNQPSHPKVVRGRDEIGAYLADICGRDMTHSVDRLVITDEAASYVQNCRYPSGARVLCMVHLDLKDGEIIREYGVQAWDE